MKIEGCNGEIPRRNKKQTMKKNTTKPLRDDATEKAIKEKKRSR